MGRVHLVGEAPAGLSGRRRSGLRDLAIAVAAGALIWIGDSATGGHLAGAVNTFAARLAVWFEDRREPILTCEPGKPRPYSALTGVVLQVPQCWEVEVVPLLDREVHRFHDPEARAGTLSVSVEPIGSDDDRRELAEEFDRMAALPGARVDGERATENLAKAAAGDAGADGTKGADAPPPSVTPGAPRAHYEPSVPDSLAERILHGASGTGEGEEAPSLEEGGEPGGAPARRSSFASFRRVEAGGLVGVPPKPGKSALQPDGTYAKRTWSWLLVGDRQAVRIVYAVRADWSKNSIVAKEFERASAVAQSAAPAESSPSP